MRTFVISDIHGCYRTFDALLHKIGLGINDELYLLGDYIDRGPASKEVLDLILKLKEDKYQLHCLLGNHEDMMLYALENPTSSEAYTWKAWNGGAETLHSFGVTDVDMIDQKYFELIHSMGYYMEKGRFILVHAGLNFEKADPFSDYETMLWSFEDKPVINKKWLGDRIVIHGHRIRTSDQIKENIKQLESFPILGIDNGCVYQKKRYNQLCALELNSMDLVFEKNKDL